MQRSQAGALGLAREGLISWRRGRGSLRRCGRSRIRLSLCPVQLIVALVVGRRRARRERRRAARITEATRGGEVLPRSPPGQQKYAVHVRHQGRFVAPFFFSPVGFCGRCSRAVFCLVSVCRGLLWLDLLSPRSIRSR